MVAARCITKETDDERGSRRASVADVVKRCLHTSSLDGESVLDRTTDAERRESVFTCNTASNDTELGKERKFCICNALNDTGLGKERKVCICNTELSGRQQQ